MEQQLSEIDPTHLSVGAGLSYLGMLIREKAYADLAPDAGSSRTTGTASAGSTCRR